MRPHVQVNVDPDGQRETSGAAHTADVCLYVHFLRRLRGSRGSGFLLDSNTPCAQILVSNTTAQHTEQGKERKPRRILETPSVSSGQCPQNTTQTTMTGPVAQGTGTAGRDPSGHTRTVRATESSNISLKPDA